MDQYVTRMDYVDLDRQAQEMRSNTPSIKQMRFREMVTTGLSVEAVFFLFFWVSLLLPHCLSMVVQSFLKNIVV